MRLLGALVAIVALAACAQNAPVPSPSPSSPAKSAAADLRTRLDVLLAEHVMIVAKESAAAVNHSDEYALYTPVLGLNSSELSRVIAQGLGNTAGVQFMNLWTAQNGDLVDYAIGVVTHNDDKANAAMASLTSSFAPQLTQFLTLTAHLPGDAASLLITQQITLDKALIDNMFAGDLRAFYAGLHQAYEHASRLGDVLAERLAADFPDKFPGDPRHPSVDARVTINLALQEHSYLATMATDAAVNGRTSDRTEALNAIMANDDAMRSVVQDDRFLRAWSFEIGSLDRYASSGDPSARIALTETFVSQLATAVGTPSNAITYHVNATVKVVDDQRAKAPTLAGDDRAAATSMQPIADSVLS